MIVTARLRGLPLAQSDLGDLIPLHRDERVLRAFAAEPGTDEETRAFLARKLAHWKQNGFGIWMFRTVDGNFAGRCGIHRWRGEVELGYIVLPELWGRGYATEMAQAVAAHAFTALALTELVAFTKVDNVASRRVMEKVGFRYQRDFVEDDERHVLYRLTPRTLRLHSASLAQATPSSPEPQRRTPRLEFMDTHCLKIRLKPDSIGRVREWATELRARPGEVLATLRDEGILVESVFLDSTPDGEFLIYYVKAKSMEAAREAVQRSTHPIDAYHQQFKIDTWEARTLLELLIDFENFS